MTLFVVN